MNEPAQVSRRGYFALALCQPKTPANVGAILRAAQCWGAAFVATSGRRFESASTDTMKAYRHLPLQRFPDTEALWGAMPFDCVPVAVEITDHARDLAIYGHPERAVYFFGPEDGSVPRAILDKCRDTIQIPTLRCLNLAAAASVVCYDRCVKTGART